MAYTIIRSDGTTLTTIQDGTINTTSTSLGLPGKNFSGYGQIMDTNLVRMTEHFAGPNPPSNPIKGQLWYDTSVSGSPSLRICPKDNALKAEWFKLTTTASDNSTSFGNITFGDLLTGKDILLTGNLSADKVTARLIDATERFTTPNADITTANISTLITRLITTNANLTAAPNVSGAMYGTWSFTGNAAGNTMVITTGNITVAGAGGIKCDRYMYANGSPFTIQGYTNQDAFNYLTGSNGITQFTGNIAPTKVTTTALAGGGTVSGIWTLATGARFEATYADLAERFEADTEYDPGTVVEIGGEKEITAVSEELSEDVFGVVSGKAAYLMNGTAGTDKTHPAVAVSGRVPVKVVGKVRKGQRLVSAGNGMARSGKKSEITSFNTIGRALTNKEDDGVGVVEAIVSIRT